LTLAPLFSRVISTAWDWNGSGRRNANSGAMSSISNISSSYLQSMLSSALQNTGLTSQSSSTSMLPSQSDNGQLSPFAQVMSTLQQLQQSDPAKYQQVTQQIATNLQSAAQTATSEGNTTAATQLNQLSNDFSTASKNGQLPNIPDMAQAMSGHHHHHHAHAASGDSSSNSNTNSDSSNSADALSQAIAAFQANGTESQSIDPMNIILNTLSSAGIGGSNS
jgi:hypothetical protein